MPAPAKSPTTRLIRVKPHRMEDLQPGDELIKLSSGGGGVGSPFERNSAAVLDDIANGFVSRTGAELIYGVAVDPKTMTVDEMRTAELRSRPPPLVEVVMNELTLNVELRPLTGPKDSRSVTQPKEMQQ